MRLIGYILCFILFYSLLNVAESQNRKNQKSNDLDSSRETRYKKDNQKNPKYKFDGDNGRNNYKVDKYEKDNCRGKNCDKKRNRENDDSSEIKRDKYNMKYTKKLTKTIDGSEEQFKKKKNMFINDGIKAKQKVVIERNFENKKGKAGKTKAQNEEDSEESYEKNEKHKINVNGHIKKQLKTIGRTDKDTAQSKIKRDIKNIHKKKEESNDTDEESDEESDEDDKDVVKIKIKKGIKKSKTISTEDSEEDDPKTNKKRKIFAAAVDDSDEETNEETDEEDDSESEEETDERNETEEVATGACAKKSNCPKDDDIEDEDGSDESNERKGSKKDRQKIKYSFKFAHEKQKSVPSEDENIMKKIHRGKKYKYEDDDDDESSEEHIHPKRVRYLEEDDD